MGCSSSNPRAEDERARDRAREALILDSKNLRVKLVLLGWKILYSAPLRQGIFRPEKQSDRRRGVLVSGQTHYASCTVPPNATQTVSLPDGRTVKFEIWDTAGQERYASLAPLYYRGASAACVVFDLTNGESFRKAHSWVKELQKHAGPRTIIALVGNKSDLAEQREVSLEEATSFAEQNGLALYLETSAKTADRVNDLFSAIAAKLPQEGPPITGMPQPGGPSGVGGAALSPG